MDITTTIDGTSARIIPRGDIDYDTLPPIRAAVDALPTHVTDLLWDLNHTPFMDLAGLHLLFTPTRTPGWSTTVTGLHPQPLRLLLLATDIQPHAFDLTRLIPDTPPTTLSQ
ncbi:STAS domain-containing protein [Streptomyces seoulensis]